MKVFKFGGASLANTALFENLPGILEPYREQETLIVVSALGKTTNALEEVALAFYSHNKDLALSLFESIKHYHLTIARYLLVKSFNKALDHLQSFFTEVEWILHDKPVLSFEYYHDQIVCTGELLSSFLMSAYLNESGISNQWLDIRDVLRTDNTFREAGIDWKLTMQLTNEFIAPALKVNKLVIVQGFIGATDENESTTLGREGSDYSAAVFANLLNAESVTFWKDVIGIFNADPKKFTDTILMKELHYAEMIEMAYYGAQVIHPNTIRPLQNKGIPLFIKCFLDTSLPGTVIQQKIVKELPAIRVVKDAQVLVSLTVRDFAYIGEHAAVELYKLFEVLKLKPNLIQHGAIKLMCCLDDFPERIEKLAIAASTIFDVQIEKGLTLLTIRHYSNLLLDAMVEGKQVLLKQQTPDTVQVLVRGTVPG
ncbi:MAG: aspartate kinase [Chitinophagaceae bacterium]